MLSKDQIIKTLKSIAENNNLTGESVDLLIDLIAYAMYTEQFNIMTAIQENNLSTAKLMNSKIRSCMNVMYPVYRGRNARVKLLINTTQYLNKSKFDVLYSSNTFKLYAEDSLTISPTLDKPVAITGILCKTPLYENTFTIDTSNRYYIDFMINQKIIGNLSEDIRVFIDDKEYKVTRNFFDFIRQNVSAVPGNYYQIEDKSEYYIITSDYKFQAIYSDEDFNQYRTDYPELEFNKVEDLKSVTDLPSMDSLINDQETLFALTITDFGVRLYKRGYFKVSSKVKVQVLDYTTLDSINTDEFTKIKIPGTTNVETVISDGVETYRSLKSLDKNNVVPRYYLKGCGAIKEIEREPDDTVLMNANYYERLQGQMVTKADINLLFNEYFIELVLNSINYHEFKPEEGKNNIYIYYVPKVDLNNLTKDEIDVFISKYKSYFISDNLQIVMAQKIMIPVKITLYVNSMIDLSEDINLIFNQYSNKINSRDKSAENQYIINWNKIRSSISKLDSVDYVEDIQFGQSNGDAYYIDDVDMSPVRWVNNNPEKLRVDADHPEGVPTYYGFKVDIIYKSNYENLS